MDVASERAREACHDGQMTPSLLEGIAAEEHPSDDDDEKQVGPPDGARHSFEPSPETRALQHQKEAVEEAPDDERPGRAVPETTQEEHDDQIHVGPAPTTPVAAEGDVQV